MKDIWFGRYKDFDAAKERYKELVKKFHPDSGIDPDNDLMVEINLAWENYNKELIQEPIEEIIQVAEKPKPKQKIKISKETKNKLVKTTTEFGESLGRLGGELIVKNILSSFFKVTK